MTAITAHVDVITGDIWIDAPDAEDTDMAVVDGRTVFTSTDVEPWGEQEEDMDRADAALAGLGWDRTGPWTGDGRDWTANVRPRA